VEKGGGVFLSSEVGSRLTPRDIGKRERLPDRGDGRGVVL